MGMSILHPEAFPEVLRIGPSLVGDGALQSAEAPWQDRQNGVHQVCRLLVAGNGDKGQQAVAGAVLKLLSSCPLIVLGLPQLMAAAGSGEAAAGWLSLLHSKAHRQACHHIANPILVRPGMSHSVIDVTKGPEFSEIEYIEDVPMYTQLCLPPCMPSLHPLQPGITSLMDTVTILTMAFSEVALIRRLPDGLPLVLYLPRVDSWAYGKVQLQAQGVECSPADNAPEKHLQHSPAASPFRCAAFSLQRSDFRHRLESSMFGPPSCPAAEIRGILLSGETLLAMK